MEHEDLIENKLHFVGKKPSTASKKQSPSKVFNEHPIIYREQGSGTQITIEAYLRTQGIPAHAKLELISNEAIKQVLLAGLGYSVMPQIGIQKELGNSSKQLIFCTSNKFNTERLNT